MTTHFLEVGSLRDELQEIRANADYLWQLLSMTHEQRTAMDKERMQQGELRTHGDDVRQTLQSLVQQAQSLVDFLDQFESAPVIYTGSGSTAEVLAKLDRLVAMAEREER